MSSVRLAAAAAVQLALPHRAFACSWCVASAFGDRTFNWPYLGLILMPFIVAAGIAGALAYYAGVGPFHRSADGSVSFRPWWRGVEPPPTPTVTKETT